METVKFLLMQSKFWTMLFIFLGVILSYVAPNFPKEIITASDLFVGGILALLVGQQTYSAYKGNKVRSKTEEKKE